MKCFCCDADVPLARKVRIRRLLTFDPAASPSNQAAADSAAYKSYQNESTYRPGIVCLPCYRLLDSADGTAEVGATTFNIAGVSRGDKASVFTEEKYGEWQRKEAAKLGVDI